MRLCFFWIQYLLVGDCGETHNQDREAGRVIPPASMTVFHGSPAVPNTRYDKEAYDT